MTAAFGRRILILVPHPDDEVVACCAAIGRAQAAGATVFASYLTHGCYDKSLAWPWQRKTHVLRLRRRHQEARQVAVKLGIQPLTWSKRPSRQLWAELPQALEEIQEALEQLEIDQVWVPAYEGGHPDHDALNALGAYLSAMLSVIEFAEYNFMHGTVQNNRFPYPTSDTVVLDLTPDERELKQACLQLYASESRNLRHVPSLRESYRPIMAYDYRQPPHPGLLWYRRFQWVPFHHPDINRVTAAQVTNAILSFQQAAGTLRR